MSAATAAAALALVTGLSVPRVSPSAVAGRWLTIDDATRSPRSVVRISFEAGQLKGVVERIFLRPEEGEDPICSRCRGPRKGRKIMGMEILWGHHQEGDRWTGGTILDPENGKEYASSVWLESGNSLKVRGHWGPFYRTQTWHRME